MGVESKVGVKGRVESDAEIGVGVRVGVGIGIVVEGEAVF